MPSDEDVISAMQKSKSALVDDGANEERRDNLKELCKDWWRSPAGKEAIRNAK